MRKIIVSNYVTVDGFFAGPAGEIDWFGWNREIEQYTIELGRSIDTILFGRVTYEMMASYWPTASEENPAIANMMNSLQKIVFSRSLKKAEWKNTRIVRDIDIVDIERMKNEPGKDMVIYGSGTIVQSLTNLGLIDEYHLFVNPLVLGIGKPLFSNMKGKVPLKLVSSRAFGNGVVVLVYRPERNILEIPGETLRRE